MCVAFFPVKKDRCGFQPERGLVMGTGVRPKWEVIGFIFLHRSQDESTRVSSSRLSTISVSILTACEMAIEVYFQGCEVRQKVEVGRPGGWQTVRLVSLE